MSQRRCAYEVLGIEKNADAAAIKKSFRKLAMKLHPDRNPDDPGAADKFDEVQKAYNLLGDEGKRTLYDKGGYEAVDGISGPAPVYRRPSFNEVAKSFGINKVVTPEDNMIFDRKGKSSSAFLKKARARTGAASSPSSPAEETPAAEKTVETKPQAYVTFEKDLCDLAVEALRAAGENDIADLLAELKPHYPETKDQAEPQKPGSPFSRKR